MGLPHGSHLDWSGILDSIEAQKNENSVIKIMYCIATLIGLVNDIIHDFILCVSHYHLLLRIRLLVIGRYFGNAKT